MFLQAGFNGRHYNTGIKGWTRHVTRRAFAPAQLIEFAHGGDLAWRGRNFLAWGDQCVFGSYGFDLPWEFQNGLAHSDIATREEHPAWEWAEKRRAAM